MTSRRRRSSIEVAALDGDVQQVVELIKSGADLNAFDAGGRTPLHNAVFGGNAHITTILLKVHSTLLLTSSPCSLLQNGADPEVVTEDGRTALLCTAHSGSEKVAEALLDAGANVEAVDKVLSVTRALRLRPDGHRMD